MDSSRTVECFTFTFGIFVFLFPENFLTQAKCTQIFQKPSERWNKLASENLYVSNALNVAKLKLGSFESVDDFYKSRLFFKQNKGKELEKMSEIFVDDSQQTEERKAVNKDKKEGRNKMYKMNNVNQAQVKTIFSPQEQIFCSITCHLRNEIDKMKLQIEKFKKLFLLLSSSPTSIQGLENLENLKKLLQLLEIKLEEELSKTTTDNRLQIGSVFFINELQMDDPRKEPDNQLAMKEVLNNLEEDLTLSPPSANPPTTLYTTAKPYDMNLIKQFFKMFPNQDVTLEQLNQMSKIIDFVERYHGLAGNLENLNFWTFEEKMRGMS